MDVAHYLGRTCGAGRLASLVVLAGPLSAPSLARAEAPVESGKTSLDAGDPEPRQARVRASLPSRDRDFEHPYGAVEFGVGVLALPDAEVCGGGQAGCERGDVSLEVDAWPLFRPSPLFAVGAGITLALTPTQDVPSTSTRFPREHSRRYFLVEGIGRYYFVYGRAAELWAGLSTGLVVVSDNFESRDAPSDLVIGGNSANIATEGLSLGLATGVTLGISDALQLGGTLRVANWFLPSTPEVLAFGEEASLSGRVTMLNLALTLAYHGR